MNRKLRRRNSIWLLWGLVLAALPLAGMARICSEVEALKDFSESDQLRSGYFDEYFIKKQQRVFHIHFRKRIQLDFSAIKHVLNGLEDYPEFMPGYKAIKVKRNSDGEILTGIRFRPSFSFFVSRFTNQVEISDGTEVYKQCWQQLEENDKRVIEEHKSAPVVNKGYWRLEKKEDDEIEISYFSVIQPPLPIPAWLYRRIVKGSYEEVCRKVVMRALPPWKRREP